MAVERGACVPAPGGRNKMNFKTSIFQMILLYFCGPASYFNSCRQTLKGYLLGAILLRLEEDHWNRYF